MRRIVTAVLMMLIPAASAEELGREVPWWKSAMYLALTPTFPDTYIEDKFDFEVGDQLMTHPNVTMEWITAIEQAGSQDVNCIALPLPRS